MAPCIFVLLLSWQCIGRRCGTLWPVTSNILLIQYLPILDKSCWSKLHETHVVSPCFTYKYAWKIDKNCTDCSTKSPYSKRIVRARCAARFGPWRCSSRLQPLLDRFEELLRLQHKALWKPSTSLNFTQLVPTGSNCYWNNIETVLQYVSICHNRILIFTWETPAALPGEGIEQHVRPTSIATKPPSDILSPCITLDRARHKLVVIKLREVCAVVCCTTHWKAINQSIGKELHEILREKCQSWRNRVSKVQTLTMPFGSHFGKVAAFSSELSFPIQWRIGRWNPKFWC